MKKMRRIASGIAALTLAACMAVPMTGGLMTASAVNVKLAQKLDAADKTTHTYTAYQIFSGTSVAVEDKIHLASIKWGSNIDTEALLGDQAYKTFCGGTAMDAPALAEKMSKLSEDSAEMKQLAQILANHLKGTGTAITEEGVDLNDGYYLVKDSYSKGEDGASVGDALSLHMMQVVGGEGDITFTPKKDYPTFEKKLKDVNDTEAASGTNPTGWQDSADYDIGDTVPFQLKATLPDDFGEYDSYKMVFHDDLGNTDSEPFDILPNAEGFNPKVYIDINGDGIYEEDMDVLLTGKADEVGDYTITKDELAASGKFSITIDDLKSVTLGDKVIVPETTKVVVEYEAKLNDNAVIGDKGNWNEAYLTYSNNPNVEAGGDDSDTPSEEDTPHDKVVVFTYQTTFNKIDPDLSGDDRSLKGAGFTLYKQYATQQEGKGDNKATDLGKPGTEYWYEVEAFENTDGNQTTFEFKGLDDGTYLLKETKTPEGYNTMADVVFDITATHDPEGDAPTLSDLRGADKNVDEGRITLTADKSSGTLSADIENKEGTVLPGTGGIGTTIFYVVGGVLVVGAGVTLIAKKRAQKED